MSVTARELETFFRKHGSSEDAELAAGLAVKAKAIEDKVGLSVVTSRVQLPDSVRRGVLKEDPRDIQDLKEALKAKGREVSDRSWEVLENVGGLTGQGPDLELVIPSASDLGFTHTITHREFLEAGQAAGLNLIHPEVFFYQGLKDQPLNDIYWAGMNTVVDRDRRPRVLALGHRSSGLWLDADWVDPRHLWYPGGRLAFSASK